MSFVQDQKGFEMGQVSPAVIAKLGDDYFSSAASLKNFIVNRDGSLSIRPGMKERARVPLPDGVRSMVRYKGTYFILSGDATLHFLDQDNQAIPVTLIWTD